MIELVIALITNITGMYLLGILLWYSHRSFPLRNSENSYLYLLYAASFVELATHLTTTVVQYYNFFGNQRLGIIMYSFVFTINAVYLLAWVLYLNRRLGKNTVHDRNYKKSVAILTAPILLLLGISILNMFIPVYFSYYNMDYQRKNWYYLTLLIPIAYMVYGIVLFLRTKQRRKLYQELPFVSFILPVVIAHVLESFFIDLCVIPLANTMALVILVLTLARQNASVDPISGVYTKSEMYKFCDNERSQNSFSGDWTGIMIRMEYLKSINDQHGHKTGDQAISDLGYLIRSNIPNAAVAFHYSDDTFIVLMEHMGKDEARSVISRLKSELLKYNQKTATVYELHTSYGIAVCEENDNIDRLIDRMEKRLNANRQGKLQAVEDLS